MDNSPIHTSLADIARSLQHTSGSEATTDDAARIALEAVRCDAVSISSVYARRKVETLAATHESARRADEMQYELGEGPCLDAIWDSGVVDVPRLARETRWPTWRERMSRESGYNSLYTCRLFTTGRTLGALNLYARKPDAFSAEARDTAVTIAALIASSVADTRTIDQLNTAVDHRTALGQATGIVMERYGLDATQAFALLTRLSSHTNRKVIDIAAEIVQSKRIQET